MAAPLDLAGIHAGIAGGEEGALRELVRGEGAALLHLAESVGAGDAAAVVEAALLELWASAGDWRPAEALDLLLWECVRDTALAVRERSVAPRRAAADWRPRAVEARLPLTGLAAGISPERLGDALAGLGAEGRAAIERARLRGEQSREGEDALERVCREAGIAGPRRAARLAAWTAITRLEAEQAGATVPAGFEHGLISRVRGSGGLRVRALAGAGREKRGRLRLMAVALAAACAIAAAAAGITYFATDGPIDGRAVALTADGATGVILPRWEERPAALVFWGLAAAEEGERWQLWSVRASGALAAGPFLSPNAEGRAAIPLDLDPQAEADPIAGYALTLDDPSARVGDAPSRDAVRYQFVID